MSRPDAEATFDAPSVSTAVLTDGTTTPSEDNAHGHRHLGIALAIISAAQLMVVLDATIVNIALPKIQVALGFTSSSLPWVVNAYTLAFAGLLLLGGRAGDILGRRKVFMTGIALFALASLVGGLAQSEAMMLSARIVQGVGAAIASPTALSLITTTFPAGKERNRAFGVYAAMSGAGAAVGLLLGGVLTEYDWRWTFFINVPIGALVLFLAPRFLGESERQQGRFDLPGALSATVGLATLVYGLTSAGTDGWTDAKTLTCIIAGAVLVALFLVIEGRSRHALMPLRILADRNRGFTYLVMLAVGAAIFSMFYFLGLYIQQVLGYSPVKAGVSFLPFSVGIVVAAQVAGKLVTRLDVRYISAVGALLAGGGLFWLTQLQVTSSYWPSILGPMVLLSFGMGLLFVPLTLTAVHNIANQDQGVASAVLNTMQQVGGALGLAVLATVFTRSANSKAAELSAQLPQGAKPTQEQMTLGAHLVQVAGQHAAFTVSTFIVLAGAVVILLGLNVKHQELQNDGPVAVGH